MKGVGKTISDIIHDSGCLAFQQYKVNIVKGLRKHDYRVSKFGVYQLNFNRNVCLKHSDDYDFLKNLAHRAINSVRYELM